MRAVEEAAPDGEVWTAADEAEVAVLAQDADHFLADRASRLMALEREGSRGMPEGDAVPAWAGWASVAGGTVLGLAIDRLEGGREINVLAFPLLGLMLWNVLVYLASGVGSVFGRRRGRGGGGMAGWIVSRFVPNDDGGAEARFWRYWLPPLMAVEGNRVRGFLHASAAMAVLGIIGGMYWRALVSEYRAVWESTFLTAESAGALLGVFLKPAAVVTGLEIPTLAEEAASKEETAVWIHLFAVMATLVVVLPRFALAGVCWRQGRRAARSVKLEGEGWSEYEATCRQVLRGGSVVVRVVPFGPELEGGLKDLLRAVVVARWGGAAVVEYASPVGYGGEDEAVESLPASGGECVVVVCPMSTTPEAEVQGALVSGLGAKSGGGVLVCLDARGFVERFGALPEYERRFGERRAAWERVMADARAEVAIVGGGVHE